MRKPRLSYANVVSTFALVLALSGGAYAAGVTIPRHSVGTDALKVNSVTSPKVKDGSLRVRDFASGQLPAGASGPTGPIGPAGPAGPVGPIGLTGPQGERGQQGLMGIPGLTGAPGLMGAKGPQGDAGEDGAPGATGAQGPAGQAGPAGPAGPTGPAGPSYAMSSTQTDVMQLSCHYDGGAQAVTRFQVTPSVNTHVLVGYNLTLHTPDNSWRNQFEFYVYVGSQRDIASLSPIEGSADQTTASTTELSWWGLMPQSGTDPVTYVTLKAGITYDIILEGLGTRVSDAPCQSAQISQAELTLQYAGLNP